MKHLLRSSVLSLVFVSLLAPGCGVKKETHQKVLDELSATQLKV